MREFILDETPGDKFFEIEQYSRDSRASMKAATTIRECLIIVCFGTASLGAWRP